MSTCSRPRMSLFLSVLLPVLLTGCVSAGDSKVALPQDDLAVVASDTSGRWHLAGNGSSCLSMSARNEVLDRWETQKTCADPGHLIASWTTVASQVYLFGFTPERDATITADPNDFHVEVFEAPEGQTGVYFVGVAVTAPTRATVSVLVEDRVIEEQEFEDPPG